MDLLLALVRRTNSNLREQYTMKKFITIARRHVHAADNNYQLLLHSNSRLSLYGYASAVITGITPDSYSCTWNFLCAAHRAAPMSVLILY